jgi:mono/diheme cytochrome c family protein
MRHQQIGRLTMLLAGVFAAGAVAFAVTRPAPEPEAAPAADGDPAAEAAAFQAHCASCHGPAEFPQWAARRPDPEDRRAWLEGLLQRHFPPPEEQRALVIDHIERQLADGAEPEPSG